jgi:transposase
MENTISLLNFIQDDYIPKPKEIPPRINKDLMLECEEKDCPCCGQPLAKYYTTKLRLLITIIYDLNLSVRYKKCNNPTCLMAQTKVAFHNLELERFMYYDHTYAYDVILLIGHLIFQKHNTEHKVVQFLLENHGITISQPEVNHYKRIALAISEATLISNVDKIRQGLDKQPYRIYVLDGTNSNFSKTLFIVRDLISGTVLGVAMLTEHDKDTIHQFLEGIFERFGQPDYLVGDGERGLIGAARQFYLDIPFQYCQQHFLKNLGKALMENTVKDLNKMLKKTILN